MPWKSGDTWKLTVLITFHLASDKHTTRKMLNEAQYYVFFPHSFTKSVKYVLQNYFDIEDKMIKHFKRVNIQVCLYSKKLSDELWQVNMRLGLLNDDSDNEN
jgi:hypothetical protein